MNPVQAKPLAKMGDWITEDNINDLATKDIKYSVNKNDKGDSYGVFYVNGRAFTVKVTNQEKSYNEDEWEKIVSKVIIMLDHKKLLNKEFEGAIINQAGIHDLKTKKFFNHEDYTEGTVAKALRILQTAAHSKALSTLLKEKGRVKADPSLSIAEEKEEGALQPPKRPRKPSKPPKPSKKPPIPPKASQSDKTEQP